MKKIFLCLILITILLSTYNLSFSVCPPGWDSYNYTYAYRDQNNQECYVYIKTGNNSGEHLINLECAQKGKANLSLFDLLGNLVSKKEAIKSDFILSIPVDENIISGIYLIKISIDNDFIYYNKINIIK